VGSQVEEIIRPRYSLVCWTYRERQRYWGQSELSEAAKFTAPRLIGVEPDPRGNFNNKLSCYGLPLSVELDCQRAAPRGLRRHPGVMA
jgi:hypothetical protein